MLHELSSKLASLVINDNSDGKTLAETLGYELYPLGTRKAGEYFCCPWCFAIVQGTADLSVSVYSTQISFSSRMSHTICHGVVRGDALWSAMLVKIPRRLDEAAE